MKDVFARTLVVKDFLTGPCERPCRQTGLGQRSETRQLGKPCANQ